MSGQRRSAWEVTSSAFLRRRLLAADVVEKPKAKESLIRDPFLLVVFSFVLASQVS